MNKTRILIHGATGRMGQALLRLSNETNSNCQVVAAVSQHGRGDMGVPLYSAGQLSEVPEFDVAVDFSLPEGFNAILQLCQTRKAGLVSGTTGLSDAQKTALEAASSVIPITWASNFSIGIAALHKLVGKAAHLLPGWDCDIVEAHHTQKKDAPSGTALTLGESAAAEGATPHYASIRAGDIVGEHLVQFATTGERVELIHRATNRDVFARGALHVATKLNGRQAGRYAIADLL